MDKRWEVLVVAREEKTALAIRSQLNQLLGHYISFIPCSLQDWLKTDQRADLIIFSTHVLAHNAAQKVKRETDIMILRRSLLNKSWEKILAIPLWERIMLVNDDRDSALETIALLYELGARHLELVPVYPELREIPDLDTAITPGESQLAPPSVKTIIDIGDRVVDLSTLVDLLTRFDLFNHETMNTVIEYAKTIIPRNQGLQTAVQGLMNLKNILQESLNSVDNGVITYDEKGHITVFNRAAETIFSTTAPQIMGQEIYGFLKERGMEGILQHEDIQEKITQIQKQDIIVSRKSITNHGQPTGGVLTLQIATKVKELEGKLRLQLKAKGHQAQYSFENIISKSKIMVKTLEIAKKMANNNLNILIQGETGTGKELFAHSIHNASPRRIYPFVAINCSALPDNLLESELFGYEEGAFTGARKGGKPGLFEQAHRGTLFLDEIGHISSNLQSRLIRAVQHKEILKIGGTNVLPVDVRILAATNCDLEKSCQNGDFRADLYYRLNILNLRIPSLRERKEDISLLIKYFLQQYQHQGELPLAVMEALQEYHWPGNVRELENTIDYLMVMGHETIEPKDIPFCADTNQTKEPLRSLSFSHNNKQLLLPWEHYHGNLDHFLLSLVYEAQSKSKSIGRRSLVKQAQKKGISITESVIYKWMKEMEERGLLALKRGRSGCRLTKKGLHFALEGAPAPCLIKRR